METTREERLESYFEDHGMFYADQRMLHRNVVLSIDSGILYDIKNPQDVTLIALLQKSSPTLKKATQDIENDNACWFGIASVLSRGDTLIWEY